MRSATLVLALAATTCATTDVGSNVLDNLITTVEAAMKLIKKGTVVEDNTTTLKFGTQALIESFGIPVENHTVTTNDCYQLRLFRIPKPGGKPVFIMHGLWLSSADWSVPGPNRSLPLLLANAGYDVWLGNARGNTESRHSCKYDPDKDAEFWDFGIHEIGSIDLPASIDYILTHTNQSDLHYVGFSQGTTVFFIMASEVPSSMSKIRTANLLAPIVYIREMPSLPMRFLLSTAAVNWPVARATSLPKLLEYLPHSSAITAIGKTFCKEGDLTQDVCFQLLFALVGTDWDQIDRRVLPQLLANFPAGVSRKQMAHYGQVLNALTDEFRQFDYGTVANLARYGTPMPPEYNISLVTCNTTLVYGTNDTLGFKSNVDKISAKVASSTRVEVAGFNHLDFLVAKDIKTLLNDGVLARMQSYDGL